MFLTKDAFFTCAGIVNRNCGHCRKMRWRETEIADSPFFDDHEEGTILREEKFFRQ
jgi:hypothetical protein